MHFNNEEFSKSNEIFSFSLTTRQASLLIAASLLIFFFSFMTGYFWGKKNAVAQFCMGVEQASFADRIYTSMCELSDTEPQTPVTTCVDAQQQAESQEVEVATELPLQLDHVMPVIPAAPESSVVAPGPAHHAQLIGYGSHQQADKFAQKLQKKGMPVHVETRTSKSSKGKVRSWYQVVSDDFTNMNELEALVARVTKEEKLSGVRIVKS